MNTINSDWGPLATPIHADAAQEGEPTWKDNAYLAFWDVESQVFGSVHVSTSPNKPGARRARCSFSVNGKVAEVIESLPQGSFTGECIDFGLDGSVRIKHPSLNAEFVNTAISDFIDFSELSLIPDLVPGKPLQHFQASCRVQGTVSVADGEQYTFDGRGMRDRTWGFRDETSWAEYAALFGIFGDAFATVTTFLCTDGSLVTHGFWVTPEKSEPIVKMGLRRNAAAQFLQASLELKGGNVHKVRLIERTGGFFVPMGAAETDGPAFGTYDDFMVLETGNGQTGAGLLEQGILHRVC